MHRFFVETPIVNQHEIIIPKDIRHQLINVLRSNVGDKIILFDNSGWEYVTELKNIRKNNIVGLIIDKQKKLSELSIKISLYQPILKSDKFEFILQKGTELGISNFVPIFCDRSIKRWDYDQIIDLKYPRWKKIITEASEQSERGKIPCLSNPLNFTDAINSSKENIINIIALTEKNTQKLKEILNSNIQIKYNEIGLFTGPEGGFTKKEIDLAKSSGVKPISLGNRILRAETATLISITSILIQSGEL